MRALWNRGWLVVAFALAGTTLAMGKTTMMPTPGTLNSAEGQVIFDGHPAQQRSIRSEALRRHQVIETRRGKAGLLLTPGSYLRIGDNSEVEMVSTRLDNARVKVIKGDVLLDSYAVFKHDLAVIMDGTRTRIDKKGLYGFNANQKTIGVLRGKATVYTQGSRLTVKNGRQLNIAGQPPFEIWKLNKRAFKSSRLYQWNEIRSRYEARARRSVRRSIAQSGNWYGPGWYWSHYWGSYTYLRSPGMYYAPYYGPWGWNNWGWGGWGWGDGDGD